MVVGVHHLENGQIHPVVRKLMLVNAIRSTGQGMMIVVLALYLDALGWSTVGIGGVLAAGGLLSVLLAPFVGVSSDRIGRKPFVLVSELLTAGCALIGIVSTNPVLLFISITFSGFGKADAGSSNPFAPAEQAWLASFITTSERGKIYSLNNGISFFGMAAGAILIGSMSIGEPAVLGVSSYRLAFFFHFAFSLVTSFIILTIRGEEAVIRKGSKYDNHQNKEAGRDEKKTRQEENVVMMKLAGINVLNGIAIGLTGPMMSYWFSAKFGVSMNQIGSTLALTFFATGVISILQARFSKKYGTVRSIVIFRYIASLFLILMPLLPSYALVSIVYILRTALNRGTQGAQQALSVSLTRGQRSGFASSINLLSIRLPISIGPSIAGYLFGLGALSFPFYLASGLQFSFAYLYGRTFRSFDTSMKLQGQLGDVRQN
ncbi:MFS transporter [Mesobacillus maritimus]|uniref:MFS transporter n=1 Tax=Mesobacillus maritimus TaxID=1643336 RepID=A0ABS7K1J8_9BACI|nr:MFS transporter [Mesobacillus maritimus]MBY0096127.1 MFS transporter [Mesobacillus maritimus]